MTDLSPLKSEVTVRLPLQTEREQQPEKCTSNLFSNSCWCEIKCTYLKFLWMEAPARINMLLYVL